MIYWTAYGLWALFFQVFCPITTSGFKNIPRRGGFILASNHLSNLDPMLLGVACRRRLSYVAKDSLFKNKFFSFFLYQVGAFPIRRDSPDISAVKEGLKRLKKSQGLLIFPEGTRKSKANIEPACPEPERFRACAAAIEPGVALLAVKAGVPVIPAFIRGSDKVLAPNAKFPKPGRISICFGAPVIFSKDKPYREIAGQIMQAINLLSQAPSPA